MNLKRMKQRNKESKEGLLDNSFSILNVLFHVAEGMNDENQESKERLSGIVS